MSATVSPDRILKELADLWVTMGKQGQSEAGASVLRSCTMTLVVVSEESEDVTAFGETIAALMPEHPARTVHIRLCGEARRELSERVFAQCWMPFGQRRQICCEQVEITAGDAALADLPSVVLPLAAPDLPVVLWRRTPRFFGAAEFRQLAALAHKVILDSAALPDPDSVLRRMAEASREGVVLGDLAWTRLTRWREALAQIFENRAVLARAGSLESARVSFGPGFETAARYMGAWIGAALPHTKVETIPAQDLTLRVELSGPELKVELSRRGDTLQITVNGASHYTRLAEPTDYLLMREELGIVRRDPVFEKALAAAAGVAYPTEK